MLMNCKRKIQEEDVLIYQGKKLKSQPFHYLMLNKPKGYLCANKDEKEKRKLTNIYASQKKVMKHLNHMMKYENWIKAKDWRSL